jgi:hypothetical protein
LDPHYSPSLFGLFDAQSEDERRKNRNDQYWQGVKRYREIVSRECQTIDDE